MLDEYMKIAHAQMVRAVEAQEMHELLIKLPAPELQKIASLGSVKAAIGSCDGDTFLEKFKGTELMQKAIALVEQELQLDAMDIQRREQRRNEAPESSIWDAQDKLRLQKRLLELELAKMQMGVQSPEQQAAEYSAQQEPQAQAETQPVQQQQAAQAKQEQAPPKEEKPDLQVKAALLDTAIAGLAGASKAEEANQPVVGGAVRGGLGWLGGATAGGMLGAAATNGHPLATGAGYFGGGLLGYKTLTDRYNVKKTPAYAEAAKTAFAVTEKGHQFDAAMNELKARHGAEMQALQDHFSGGRFGGTDEAREHIVTQGGAQPSGAGERLLNLIRFGGILGTGPADTGVRHHEYTAKKHQKGENAYNPLGGLMTPSKHETGGTREYLGAYNLPEEGHAAGKLAAVESFGRKLAHSDMGKLALAMPSLAGLGGFISKNPGLAGAAGGAALGAGAGALAGGPDHRLSGALGGAALGAAGGGMAGGTAGRMVAGQTAGAAATNTLRSGLNAGMRGMNRVAPGMANTTQNLNQTGHDVLTRLMG